MTSRPRSRSPTISSVTSVAFSVEPSRDPSLYELDIRWESVHAGLRGAVAR